MRLLLTNMRLLLTSALIIWPSLAYAQIGSRPTNNDDLVSKSRLGQMAKKSRMKIHQL